MKTKFESKHGIGALVEFASSQGDKTMGFITEITFGETEYYYAIECCNTKEISRGIKPSQIGKAYAPDYGKVDQPPRALPEIQPVSQ